MPTSVTLLPSARRWSTRAAADSSAELLASFEAELKLPPALCQLLLRRGYHQLDSAKLFLKPRLDQLLDPAGLAGMREAITRLDRAIRTGETVLVHGDYDVDGICSAALLTRVLRHLGARVEPFVPHRMSDGYDLSQAGVRAAAAVGATLILTGDCGIVAHDAIDAARALGIDVIVTDHHTPGDRLPNAAAVINPNRRDCSYQNKALCGAGVAFKLCHALWTSRGLNPEELWYYLDLVAVATIADLAPLTGENRVITKYGLRLLAQSRNPGMRALLQSAGLTGGDLAAGQVSHVLAPRINAVGRMSEASKGVRLLLEENDSIANVLAATLEEENRTRQLVDRQTLAQAMEMLEGSFVPERDYVVVLGGQNWHSGVIGIVASRVVERLHRPTVLFALNDDAPLARGSARSIPGFNLYDALKECSGYLERFGGHKYAAGMDIKPENIDAFRAAFQKVAEQKLTPQDLVPEIWYDLELDIDAVNEKLLKLLKYFGPFGVGNPTPIFVSRQVRVIGQPREVGEGHIKFELTQGGTRLSAIGFGMAEQARELDVVTNPIDIAYQLQENVWNGRIELQARLLDMKPATGTPSVHVPS